MDEGFQPSFVNWTDVTPLQAQPPTTGAGLLPSSTATMGSCEAKYAGGKRAGVRCENPVKSACGRFCNMHGKPVDSDKRGLLVKKRSKGDHPSEPSAGDGGDRVLGGDGDAGSDAEPTGDLLDDYEGVGSKVATPKERRRTAKIKEEPYRRAYVVVRRNMALACRNDDAEREAEDCCFSATGIDLMDQLPDGDFKDGGANESGSAGNGGAGCGGAGDGGIGASGGGGGGRGDGGGGDGDAGLMSMCEEGHPSKGRRRKKVPAPTPGTTAPIQRLRLESLAGSRRAQCQSRKCANRGKEKKAIHSGKGERVSGRGKSAGAPKQECTRGARVRTGCRCVDCVTVGGVVMCGDCFFDDTKHRSAFEHASSQRKNGGSRIRSKKLEFLGDAYARRGGGGGVCSFLA